MPLRIVMKPNFSKNLHGSPIYSKALEIFHIAKGISRYLSADLSSLQHNGGEDPHIYFTGDIIQQSVSLAPEILKAESKTFSEEKHKHTHSITRLANSLYKNCERLENVNSNGKDFLSVLRKEIKKFKVLQKNWMLTL